jgi:hypothetical protein
MVWAMYLLNEFIDDCLEAQDLDKEFHYWPMLLLIVMILWRPPPPGHEDEVTGIPLFVAPKFLTLQYTKEQEVEATHHKSFHKW